MSISRNGLILALEKFPWWALSLSAEPVVDALMGELTHMVLGLHRGGEGAIGEQGLKARAKVDLTFPCP